MKLKYQKFNIFANAPFVWYYKNMFINKLNQLYKPKRIVYYMDASLQEIKAFYKGTLPPAIEKYSNAFWYL